MRFSQLFVPTLKEDPKDAEVASHRLMLRAGMIRQLGSGLYTYLPLGLRVIQKVESIIRDEMNRIGSQEVLMPSIIPSELWQKTGRWDEYGHLLLRLKDRLDREYCYGPTHEEVVTDLISSHINSYKQLPLTLYQIQTKFRDEIRPRFGLMRSREFSMKDAYSFHAHWDDLNQTYHNMVHAYESIFTRCGLRFKSVCAESGEIGGSESMEFMVTADTGEDEILESTCGGFSANAEAAPCVNESVKHASLDYSKAPKIEYVDTPHVKTIDEVSDYLSVDKKDMVKTLLFVSDEKPIVVMVRGDHLLNEYKLKKVLSGKSFEKAPEALVQKVSGTKPGYLGPVNLQVDCDMFADFSLQVQTPFIAGANQSGQHIKNMIMERDCNGVQFADLRFAVSGDACPVGSEDSVYQSVRGIEVGHVFKLGDKYSTLLGAQFLDEQGKSNPIIMGCYGIGVGRTVAAAIEQNQDDKGIVWPLSIAPFSVNIIIVNRNRIIIRCIMMYIIISCCCFVLFSIHVCYSYYD